MDQAIAILWTVGPFAMAMAAITICAHRIAACLLLTNLLLGQEFSNKLPLLYSHWAAAGFGAIDYVTAIALFAAGAWRCSAIFALSVIIHIHFALVFYHHPDPVMLYAAALHYGWWTFALSMLAGITLIGGNGGRGRRIRNGAIGSHGRRHRAWLQAAPSHSWRVRR